NDLKVPSERVDLNGDDLPAGAVARLCYPVSVIRLAVSPDGKKVATGSHPCGLGTVCIFDTASGRIICRLAEMRGWLWSIAFSHAGAILATAHSLANRSETRDEAGHITFWDAATGEELCQFGEGTGPRALAFSADGKSLASAGGDGCIWWWDIETQEKV